MLKNILVPATGTGSDQAVFATALCVARLFAAHLDFLHVRIDTTDVLMSMTAGGIGGGDALQAVVDRMDAVAAEQERVARTNVDTFVTASGLARLDAPGGQADRVSAGLLVEVGSQSQWVAQHGRFADLVVMGRGAADDGTQEVLEAALMDTGKPLLIAPAAAPASVGDVVLIAWKDTPEAARAVAAALPLIARARRVVIATVNEADDESDAGASRVLRSLRWHNPATEMLSLVRDSRRPVEVLLHHGAAIGADLLVMGGYSHSRLREVVLGGFTREILAAAAIPVLLAH